MQSRRKDHVVPGVQAADHVLEPTVRHGDSAPKAGLCNMQPCQLHVGGIRFDGVHVSERTAAAPIRLRTYCRRPSATRRACASALPTRCWCAPHAATFSRDWRSNWLPRFGARCRQWSEETIPGLERGELDCALTRMTSFHPTSTTEPCSRTATRGSAVPATHCVVLPALRLPSC